MGEEQRKEERFPAALLPDYLQYIRVLFDGLETKAKLIDASFSGFGFQIDIPPSKFVVGSSLVIYPKEDSHALYGTIVFVKAIDETRSRIGVLLKEVGLFSQYQKELKQIISFAGAPQ